MAASQSAWKNTERHNIPNKPAPTFTQGSNNWKSLAVIDCLSPICQKINIQNIQLKVTKLK